MKKSIILFSFIVFFIASCTITQEYHFKNDFSGSGKTSIDLSMFINFMNSLDTTGNGTSLDTLDQSMAEAAVLLENAGAQNVQYGWNDDKTVLYVSYDFQNIETLNKTLESDPAGTKLLSGSPDHPKFTVKGKKISYDTPEISQNDTLFNSESMASMKDYYKYSLVFNFDREIKSFDNKAANLSDDKKSISFSGNIADMFAKGSSFDINIKLKKK